MKFIYADYAATSPADKRVVKIILPYFSKVFGNPSSLHYRGFEAKNILAESRSKVAAFFNCLPEEIIFTSGGTESENLAIKGIAFSNRTYGKHIIISSVEHASVDSSANFLEKQGFHVTRIPVDHNCVVDVQKIEAAIKDDTTLISVMYVNNEIGTVQPIEEIAEMLKSVNLHRQKSGKHSIRFHVDGEAGSIYKDYNVIKLGCDSLSVNGSKVYSLKGASALYIKKNVGIATQICGGGQELMRRGGTENISAIVALAEALTIVEKERAQNVERMLIFNGKFRRAIEETFPGVRVNTPLNSVPNILHVTFIGFSKIDIVGRLSELGICVSSGSACASNKKSEKSRILQVMGFNENEIDMSVRFSFGKSNCISDINSIVRALKSILKK